MIWSAGGLSSPSEGKALAIVEVVFVRWGPKGLFFMNWRCRGAVSFARELRCAKGFFGVSSARRWEEVLKVRAQEVRLVRWRMRRAVMFIGSFYLNMIDWLRDGYVSERKNDGLREALGMIR